MSYENYCPYCGKPKYDEAEDCNEYVSKQPKALDRDKEWARVKSLVARRTLEKAREICELLIADDPAGVEGYLGLVRVATENYTLYDSQEIDTALRIALEMFDEETLDAFDPAYALYKELRGDYFERIKEREKARKEKEAAKSKEESPFVIIEDMLVKYNGDAPYVVIPQGVKKIGAEAFAGNTTLCEVLIPEGVTAIRRYAFNGCSKLSNVEIPSTLQSIDYGAFYNCASISLLKIPKVLASIGAYAFNGCSSLKRIEYAGTKDMFRKIIQGDSWYKGGRLNCSDGYWDY